MVGGEGKPGCEEQRTRGSCKGDGRRAGNVRDVAGQKNVARANGRVNELNQRIGCGDGTGKADEGMAWGSCAAVSIASMCIVDVFLKLPVWEPALVEK